MIPPDPPIEMEGEKQGQERQTTAGFVGPATHLCGQDFVANLAMQLWVNSLVILLLIYCLFLLSVTCVSSKLYFMYPCAANCITVSIVFNFRFLKIYSCYAIPYLSEVFFEHCWSTV